MSLPSSNALQSLRPSTFRLARQHTRTGSSLPQSPSRAVVQPMFNNSLKKVAKVVAPAGLWVAKNAYDIMSATEDNTDSSSRLGLIAATRGFEKGQLGLGVHRAAKGIYIVLGPLGQAEIGKFFAQPNVRELLTRTDDESFEKAGVLEYEYWDDEAQKARALETIQLGAEIAGLFKPKLRKYIMEKLSEAAPVRSAEGDTEGT